MRSILYVSVCALLLSGCATIVKGTRQPLQVDTGTVSAAQCRGVDRDGTRYEWTHTPAEVVVKKGKGPLTITCEKTGFEPTTVTVEREGNYWPAGGFLFGLTGGFISIIVDETTGAAGNYPESVSVELKPAS